MSRSLQLLLLAGVIACAGNPGPRAETPVCSGIRFVAVTNNWNRTIDVHTYSSGGASNAVGSVPPGSRAEFPLFESRGITFRLEGSRVGRLPDEGRARIQTEYLCR